MMDEILMPTFMVQTAFFVVTPLEASRWVSYVHAAGLEELLTDPNKVGTFLVPSNDAFAALDPERLRFWESPAGHDDRCNMLRRHIVPGTLIAWDSVLTSSLSRKGRGVVAKQSLLDGVPIKFEIDANTTISSSSSGIQSLQKTLPLSLVKVNSVAHVVTPNILASNGIVHIIDKVLLPEAQGQVNRVGTAAGTQQHPMTV